MAITDIRTFNELIAQIHNDNYHHPAISIEGHFFTDTELNLLMRTINVNPACGRQLQTLDISFTKITKAPDLASLINLRTLSLCGNFDMKIAPDVTYCKKLEQLIFMTPSNDCGSPTGLANCTNLKKFHSLYEYKGPLDLTGCFGSLTDLTINFSRTVHHDIVLPLGLDLCTELKMISCSDPIIDRGEFIASPFTRLSLIQMGIIYRRFTPSDLTNWSSARKPPFCDWLPEVHDYFANPANKMPLDNFIMQEHFNAVLTLEAERMKAFTLGKEPSLVGWPLSKFESNQLEVCTEVLRCLGPQTDQKPAEVIESQFSMMRRIFDDFADDMQFINEYESRYKSELIAAIAAIRAMDKLAENELKIQAELKEIASVKLRLRG